MITSGKIVLLGGNGFIAKHLTAALIERGSSAEDNAEIVVVSRTGNGQLPKSVTEVTADVGNVSVLRNLLEDCTTVVHLASESTPSSFAGMPVAELEKNLLPTLRFFELIHEYPEVNIVYMSTGGALYGDAKEKKLTESTFPEPSSYYAAGKASAEVFIHALIKQTCGTAVILRPSNVYGPGQSYREGFGIVPTLMNCLSEGLPLTVWGGAGAKRDYLYIDDLVELLVQIVGSSPEAGVHTYNVGSGVSTSLYELIQLVEVVGDRKLTVHQSEGRQVDPYNVVLDVSRVANDFNWQPKTSLEDGLRATWQWWRRQRYDSLAN